VRRRELCDRGAAAVEYALIIAAVALILIPVAMGLERVLSDVLESNCKQTASQNAGTASEQAQNVANCER